MSKYRDANEAMARGVARGDADHVIQVWITAQRPLGVHVAFDTDKGERRRAWVPHHVLKAVRQEGTPDHDLVAPTDGGPPFGAMVAELLAAMVLPQGSAFPAAEAPPPAPNHPRDPDTVPLHPVAPDPGEMPTRVLGRPALAAGVTLPRPVPVRSPSGSPNRTPVRRAPGPVRALGYTARRPDEWVAVRPEREPNLVVLGAVGAVGGVIAAAILLGLANL